MQPYLYTLLVALGTVTSLGFIFRQGYPRYLKKVHRPRVFRRHITEAVLLIVFCIVMGARAGYVWLHWNRYASELRRVLQLWEGGLVFHGGLAGAMLGLLLYRSLRNVPVRHVLDMAVPYVCIGYAIGRIGCFLNGCCAGRVTDLPWGVAFPDLLGSQLRHPTQLYASGAAVGIFVLLAAIYTRSRFPGTTTGAFFVLFGTYRFLMEFLRLHMPVDGGLSPFQWTALVMTAVGIALVITPKKYVQPYRKGG